MDRDAACAGANESGPCARAATRIHREARRLAVITLALSMTAVGARGPRRPFVPRDPRDLDDDGIEDATELALLARFRPYYRFSKRRGRSDTYRPADPVWYIQQSELVADAAGRRETLVSRKTLVRDPRAVLMGEDLSHELIPSRTYIAPLKRVPGARGKYPGRKGAEWGLVLSRKNVGLLGHVTRIEEALPGDADRRTLYRIEYWQFFGYSTPKMDARIGDHEGDWTTVQLTYDPALDKVRAVEHWAHGRCHRFVMGPDARESVVDAPWGTYLQLDGPNSKPGNYRLDRETRPSGWRRCLNDTTLRLYEDPATKKLEHPVVFIEHGSHEFWPTERGRFCTEIARAQVDCAPNHAGDDHAYSFLTEDVPNVGEVEVPFGTPPEIVLRFSGHWGSPGGLNNSPPGPTLHCQWQFRTPEIKVAPPPAVIPAKAIDDRAPSNAGTASTKGKLRCEF